MEMTPPQTTRWNTWNRGRLVFGSFEGLMTYATCLFE
jgi:hypothetical protein